MDLQLENWTAGDWTVIRVNGELDLHTSPQLREHVLALVDDPPVRIALDISGVGFMDSSSLGTGSPMKVFALTGLDRVFDIVSSPDDLPSD